MRRQIARSCLHRTDTNDHARLICRSSLPLVSVASEHANQRIIMRAQTPSIRQMNAFA